MLECARRFHAPFEGRQLASAAAAALAGKHVVFVGDSHLRYAVMALAKFLLASDTATLERKAVNDTSNYPLPENVTEPVWTSDFSFGGGSHHWALDTPLSKANMPIRWHGDLPCGARITYLRRVYPGAMLDAVKELFACDDWETKGGAREAKGVHRREAPRHTVECRRPHYSKWDVDAIVVGTGAWHFSALHDMEHYRRLLELMRDDLKGNVLPPRQRNEKRHTGLPLVLWVEAPIVNHTLLLQTAHSFLDEKDEYYTVEWQRKYAAARASSRLTVRDDPGADFVLLDLDRVARRNWCTGGPGACTADGAHLPKDSALVGLTVAAAVHAWHEADRAGGPRRGPPSGSCRPP